MIYLIKLYKYTKEEINPSLFFGFNNALCPKNLAESGNQKCLNGNGVFQHKTPTPRFPRYSVKLKRCLITIDETHRTRRKSEERCVLTLGSLCLPAVYRIHREADKN